MENINASIIIPTCNRKELLKLSLHSFNYQDYTKDSFEVIVIDDGSIDGTSDMIKSLKVNYKLIFLRNEKNRGPAYARNLGLQNANGEIIIFSDSDCIVPSNFVSGHLKHHEMSNNICPSAAIRWKKVYSSCYEDFNNMQKYEFQNAIINIPAFKDRLKSLKFNYENNFKILSQDDVPEIDKYSYIPSWSDEYLGGIVKSYGPNLDGFEYPWILFTTGNVSIRKKHLIDVGGFDERLKRAASIYTVDDAKKNGVELIYINTSNPDRGIDYLMGLTNGKGFDDVMVFAPVRPVVEMGDKILARDGCLNFFAGPSNTAFSAEFNFYNVHYSSTHIVGTSGGNTDDMLESLDMMGKGMINPASMVTHIGGLNSVVETTLNLPKIPGGKKLIYTNIHMELIAIDSFREKGKDNQMFARLADIVEKNSGLWSADAEKYLLANAKKI